MCPTGRSSPQRAALWLPRKSIGIAHAPRKHARCAGCRLDFEYRGPVGFLLDPVLGNVAVGADGYIQPRTVRIRNDIFRPMMIDRAAGEIGHFDRRRGYL